MYASRIGDALSRDPAGASSASALRQERERAGDRAERAERERCHELSRVRQRSAALLFHRAIESRHLAVPSVELLAARFQHPLRACDRQ